MGVRILTRNLQGIVGGDSKIVRHHPKPAGARLIAIRRDAADADASLAGDACVGGRLMFVVRISMWLDASALTIASVPGFASNSTHTEML